MTVEAAATEPRTAEKPALSKSAKARPTTPPPSAPAPPAPPVSASVPPHAVDFVVARFAYLLTWYEEHAQRARHWYLGIKVAQLIVAAGVSTTAVLHSPGWLTAILGGVILVLEGVQQAFQFHDSWIRYRSTHTTLLKTLTLWEVRDAPFDGHDAVRALARTIETLAGNETAAWASSAAAASGAGAGGTTTTSTPGAAPTTPAP